jgi:hypothetical protein
MASKHFGKLGKPAIDARLHHNTDKQGVVVSSKAASSASTTCFQ